MATEWNFDYTGTEQSVVLPPGKYKFECWGACGGNAYNDSTWTSSAKGGYASGELILKENTILYIFVGQSGFEKKSTNSFTRTGFNGGGSSNPTSGNNYYYSRYGGGATDIRLVGGTWNDKQGLLSRILVADGGGNINPYENSICIGHGGGLNVNNGIFYNREMTTGGSQYQGGISYAGDNYNGSFGKGGIGRNGGGGGSGWYGGAGAESAITAAGGSGYALNKNSYKPNGYIPTSEYYLSNIIMITGGNTTKADGYAKITLLQALPLLTIASYNATQATFKADHTDPTLLTKIEYFIDDVLKETITTDLTLEKTINYTLEDNALHTLKIVVTDSANATVEKVLSISKNIMPLPENVNLNDISTKLVEVNAGFKTGKTSIINTLALKNIEASLNNTLVELSEKIKTSFDSTDASVQELQNRITELNNQLSQHKKWASGTYTFTQNDYDNFYSRYSAGSDYARTLTVPINLNFTPSFIIVEKIVFYGDGYASNFYGINNLNKLSSVGRVNKSSEYFFNAHMFVLSVDSGNFVLRTYRDTRTNASDTIYRCKVGESFTWYAYE
ncbi:hypothetical protein KWV16_17390 [Clostridioides difficile]|nr:hypothetical protein [Clostridioides difficile]